MRIKYKNYLWNTLSIIALALLLVVFIKHGGFEQTEPAYGGAAQNVSGFAWSSNIGWISFNCLDSSPGGTNNDCAIADYGVNIDPVTGNFSGYAWSEFIGYISFDAPDGGITCTSPCAKLNPIAADGTRAVTGWARACSVFAVGCSGALKPASALGGWDGWIKLSDPSWTNPANRAYMGQSGTAYDAYTPTHNGIFFDSVDKRLKGFAWGGPVVGWVDFYPSTAVGVFAGLAVPIPALSVTPLLVLDFGDTPINTTATRSFTVSNSGAAGSLLQGAVTLPASPYFTCVSGCGAYPGVGITTLTPLTVTLQFTPGATVGSIGPIVANFTGTNTTPASSENREVQGTGIVPVFGNGLAFGNVIISRSKDLTLTMSNSGATPIVDTLVMPFPVYTCVGGCAVNIPAGGSQSIIIHFTPTAAQAYNGNAFLQTNSSVTFPFSGAGVVGTFKFRDQ
jgi:hypothetical protein